MLMQFYNRTGKMAIGSRLRRLSDLITEDAGRIYSTYGVDFQPRWFPVFYVLLEGETRSVTAIAGEIGHSHVSVSQIVKEMVKKGYVTEKRDRKDGRKTLLSLSPAGEAIAERIQDQFQDVNQAIERASASTQYDLWKAIEAWETLLAERSLFERVQDERRLREGERIRIVDFASAYRQDFRALNEEWISTFFEMEEADYKALDHPEEYILDKGGYIFIALYDDKAVGTCALIKMDDGSYELAKMAVSPTVQGKGIGVLLGNAAIAQARKMGAKRVYLESNTKLKPAVQLYYKLGFQRLQTGRPTPYARCNIQMELVFES